MVDIETVRKWALAFDEVIELPHFDRTSFRVNKKIFVTLDVKNNRAVLKLSETDQSVFSAFDNSSIYPVPNKWGKHGATQVELKKVRKDLFKDALTSAYCQVAPGKLAEKYTLRRR